MTYFYRGEPASIPYAVKVKPKPTADEAKASLRKHAPDGAVARVEQLSKQGEGTLALDTNAFELADSPIFIEFAFKSGPKSFKTVRAVALAEAVPAKLDPEKVHAKKGDKVKVKVAEWAALIYDQPKKASEALEPDAARIPADVKSKVKWQLDGKDLSATGDEVTIDIEEAHEGKVLTLEAFIDEATGRAVAKIDCYVLEVQLHDPLYKPCANVRYTLLLEDGTKHEGTTDGQGWVKKQIPFAPQRVKITFTPKGEPDEELFLRLTDAGEDQDDFYLAHVENMGYPGLVPFQAAAGLPLTGELDDDTKQAIKALVKKDDQESLMKTLFDDDGAPKRPKESLPPAGTPRPRPPVAEVDL